MVGLQAFAGIMVCCNTSRSSSRTTCDKVRCSRLARSARLRHFSSVRRNEIVLANSERTADQKRLAKEQGRFLGGKTPWEKQTVKRNCKVLKLVDHPEKVPIVKKIRTWRKDGVSLRQVVSRVEALGFAISTGAIRRLSDEVRGARQR